MKKSLWENDKLQFARLISEIEVVGGFTNELNKELCDSMGLEDQDLMELIERAQKTFDKAKEKIISLNI